jgi:hypothetical protein
MPSYNFTRSADRQRRVDEAIDELSAMDSGAWPRTTDELVRFAGSLPAGVLLVDHARACLLRELEWLGSVPARVASGELSADMWEV